MSWFFDLVDVQCPALSDVTPCCKNKFCWQQSAFVATKLFRKHRAHMQPSECLSSFLSSHCQIKLSILSSPKVSDVAWLLRCFSQPPRACTFEVHFWCDGYPSPPKTVVVVSHPLMFWCWFVRRQPGRARRSTSADILFSFFRVLMECRGFDSGVLC